MPDIKLGTGTTANGYPGHSPVTSHSRSGSAPYAGVSKYSSFVHHAPSNSKQASAASGSGSGRASGDKPVDLSYTSDVEGKRRAAPYHDHTHLLWLWLFGWISASEQQLCTLAAVHFSSCALQQLCTPAELKTCFLNKKCTLLSEAI